MITITNKAPDDAILMEKEWQEVLSSGKRNLLYFGTPLALKPIGKNVKKYKNCSADFNFIYVQFEVIKAMSQLKGTERQHPFVEGRKEMWAECYVLFDNQTEEFILNALRELEIKEKTKGYITQNNPIVAGFEVTNDDGSGFREYRVCVSDLAQYIKREERDGKIRTKDIKIDIE